MPINAGPRPTAVLHAGLRVRQPLRVDVPPATQPIPAAVVPVDPCVPTTCADGSASYSYSDGRLSRVTYRDGSYYAYEWLDQRLHKVQFVVSGSARMTKTLTYNPDGTLLSVTQTGP